MARSKTTTLQRKRIHPWAAGGSALVPETVCNAARESSSNVNPDSWIEQHGDCLYRYALIRVRHPEVAEDLVQETLLAAVRTLCEFPGNLVRAKLALWHSKEQDFRLFPEACSGGILYRFRVSRGRDVSQIR